jgi:hypothetical protein
MTTTVTPGRTSANGRVPRTELVILGSGLLVSAVLTAVTGLLGRRLNRIPKWEEDIYPYRARTPDPWGERTAWLFYLLHQIFQWGCVYWAQTRTRKYTSGLHPVNVLALAGNTVFAIFHILQTHLWYDALARRISVWASQSSVIVLLSLALLIENPRRGMLLGKRLPFSRRVIDFVRRYHGYYMSWATVFTFWYHPMEGNQAHLSGLFHTLGLLMQGSLMYTRAHLNPLWTTFMEVAVLPHGVLTALMRHPRNWPMFGFGFLAMFLLTQMQGLGVKVRDQFLIAGATLLAMVAVYRRRWRAALSEPVRIPIIEYGVAAILAGLIAARQWLADRRVRQPLRVAAESRPLEPVA